MKNLLSFLTLFVCSIFSTAIAGEIEKVPIGTNFSPYGYKILLPDDYYQSNNYYPLVLYLHGKGAESEGTSETLDWIKFPFPNFIMENKKFTSILIAPQATEWWNPDKLDSMLEILIRQYRIDLNRIYVTGLSMGGGGTWDFAVIAPQKITAIIPICGASGVHLADRLVNMPVWAFHNDKDPVVPVEFTNKWIEGIKLAGGTPKVTIFNAEGHDAWNPAYNDTITWKWLFSQSKNKIARFQLKSYTVDNDTVNNRSDATVKFTAIVGDSLNEINRVYIDCFELGDKLVDLHKDSTGTYSYNYTIKKGFWYGLKNIPLTIIDKAGNKLHAPLKICIESDEVKNYGEGLHYTIYNWEGKRLPDFSKLKPMESGTVKSFFPDSVKVADYIAIKYDGTIFIPYEGIYKFFLTSDDGSRFTIDGKIIIVLDTINPPRAEKTTSLFLSKGEHRISVKYFNYFGGMFLKLKWLPPLMPKNYVPSALINPFDPALASADSEDCQLKIWPNPVENDLYLEHLLPNDIITIHDFTGREVFKQIVSENKDIQTLSLKDLKTGIYDLKINSASKGYKIIKL